ncbi:MAG TPA: BamA/TamA family outer membrane protein [Vicinamibacterales bacterium]
MTPWAMLVVALLQAPAGAATATPSQTETITAIQVHGNTATPDEEIRNLTGVQVGTPVEATTVDEVAARLRATRRFEHVEVLKRFASISDPTQIVLVVIVDEGAVHIETTGDDDHPVRAVKSHGPRLLFLPILSFEDGYGFTYGAQFARPDPLGAHSRLSFPLTWGGQKQAAIELDKTLERGPVDRITAGAAITGRTNPFYELDDNREHLWARGERTVIPHLRVGVDGGWQHVSFGTLTNSYGDVGADVIWDTRLDPMLARNAVYAKARWNHLGFGANQTELDARGYLGLVGQSILAVRAQSVTSDQAMPPYLQPLLGGTSNLRGFSAGSAVGDNLVALTGELILPLTSPLHIGKLGVSAFTDAGTVWDYGARLADQKFKQDYGGSVWVSAAFFRLRLAVAHGIGAGTRVAVDASLTF